MSLSIVYTRANCGIEAPLVTVETHLSNGLPSLSIVGLPEATVKESRDRVRSAILNSHFEFPSRRITVNLAPADLPKEGGRFDLAIALGILAASGQVPEQALSAYEFLGELSLGGELRPVRGCLSAARKSLGEQRALVLAPDNAEEAALCSGARILPAQNLLRVAAHLHGRETIAAQAPTQPPEPDADSADLLDVNGQAQAKRALEIAAAGNHNLLLYGPPGTGKTMLASRLPGILPPLRENEMLEVASIFSISNNPQRKPSLQRPFRNPHHTASAVALVGGGSSPRPGEISLAHHGVLFLDELPEFQRKVLEVLREPLESGEILISRANWQLTFPARFQLVAAMNPCPCGYYGDRHKACQCSPDQIRRYRNRVSGPLLDRIDLHISVNRLKPGDISTRTTSGDSSSRVQQRVIAARQHQIQRQGRSNAHLGNREIDKHCCLKASDQQLLEAAITQLQLSPRAYHRILKVARTIADLDASDASDAIEQTHISEALGYRGFDRENL